jgi:hypothetical protein
MGGWPLPTEVKADVVDPHETDGTQVSQVGQYIANVPGIPMPDDGDFLQLVVDAFHRLLTRVPHVEPVRARAFATLTLASNPHDLTSTPTTGGFMVDTTGVYKIRLIDDLDSRFITPYLVAGQHYPHVIGKVWATGSPAGANLTGFVALEQ